MTLDEAIQHCREQVGDYCLLSDGEAVKCCNEHRQLGEWLGQLRSVFQGDLSSLTDDQVHAISKAIDAIVAERQLKDYYFSAIKMGNDLVSWYDASIMPKAGYEEHGYHDDIENYLLIPIPDGFVWTGVEYTITNDGIEKLSKQEVIDIMTAHGFEEVPNEW